MADCNVKDGIKILTQKQNYQLIVVKDSSYAEPRFFIFDRLKLLTRLKSTEENLTLAEMIQKLALSQASALPFDKIDLNCNEDTVVLEDGKVVGVIMASGNAVMKGFGKNPPDGINSFSPPPSTDPPRAAYTLIDCQNRVKIGQQFPLQLGLSQSPTPGVSGNKIRRPDSSMGSYTIKIELVHNGFSLKSGQSSIQELWVTSDKPYPQVTLDLTAEEDPDLKSSRIILAYFYVNHQMIGSAARTVDVSESNRQPDPTNLQQNQIEEQVIAGMVYSLPTSQQAPDLTIVISNSNKNGNSTLLWSLETKHRELSVPKNIEPEDIGSSPEEFARIFMNKVDTRDQAMDLYQLVKGEGRIIAANIPHEVRAFLRKLAKHLAKRHPVILLVTQEPYLPWEMAYFDLGCYGENFFGSEFIVGRWILGTKVGDEGKLRPQYPPPEKIEVTNMAVVSGNYKSTRHYSHLAEAEEEAKHLLNHYGKSATPVNAKIEEIMSCLKQGPAADLLHFSMHGKFDYTGISGGLVMVNGKMLDQAVINSYDFTRTPFVFLNACQVGQAKLVLGDYAGIAGAFLNAGASAVVAPLFSINDKIAREMAQNFYKQIDNNKTPAEIIREERAKFHENNPELSATFIAYQFFGHPSLKLTLRFNQ